MGEVMTGKSGDLDYAGFLALLAGNAGLRERLTAGEQLQIETPFVYPGRREPVTASLVLAPVPDDQLPDERPPGTAMIRISDGGGLIKCLADQGMDLEVDMVLSRTVFHAVRQLQDAGITKGQVHLDVPVDKVAEGLWRFLQLISEVAGLRHAKYKDALLQLERRRTSESGSVGWRPT